jgi:hypothetical protein
VVAVPSSHPNISSHAIVSIDVIFLQDWTGSQGSNASHITYLSGVLSLLGRPKRISIRLKSLLSPPKVEVESTCMPCGNIFVLDSWLFLGETNKQTKTKKVPHSACDSAYKMYYCLCPPYNTQLFVLMCSN